ncbi:MAG: ribonuclease HI family protein [Candidatus Nanohaloarchaeota archaeon QJJ-5]|nr:ribonuclease HI family protein [Candidatus Nanohaloarchaeota archaeon QJJ-5]
MSLAERDSISIYTDGASRGNPGPASYAFVMVDAGSIVHEASGFLGERTNNQAEYHAIINALETAIEHGITDVTLYSDSQLVVNQLNGKWQVKDATLHDLFEQVKHLLDECNVTFTQVPRENDFVDRSDTLCNTVLDRQG